MSLPFLTSKNKKMAGIIMSKRGADGSLREPLEEAPSDDAGASLHACAQDILGAIEAKDAAKLASALRAAIEICDSEPEAEPAAEE